MANVILDSATGSGGSRVLASGRYRGARGGYRQHIWRGGAERVVPREVSGVQTHAHAGLPDDGNVYKHQHLCEDCNIVFTHTHMRRSLSQSILRQPRHVCPNCRRIPTTGPSSGPTTAASSVSGSGSGSAPGHCGSVSRPDTPPSELDSENLVVDLQAYLWTEAYLSRRTPELFRALMRKGMAWLHVKGVESEAVAVRMLRGPLLAVTSQGPDESLLNAKVASFTGCLDPIKVATNMAEGHPIIGWEDSWRPFIGWTLAAGMATTSAMALALGDHLLAPACMTTASVAAAAWAALWRPKPMHYQMPKRD